MKHTKTLSFFLSMILLCLFSFNTKQITAGTFEKNMNKGGANDTITISFKVSGTAACESNIEAALTSQAGVISANWNSTDKQMTVVFKTAEVKTSDLHSFLAMAGYDTSELRAKQNTYDALSASCKYTREAETE